MAKLNSTYDFVTNEKEVLKYWEDNRCFEKLLEKNKNGKKYRFIDGPITANNPMKLHHMWGRTLKDTYLRYKSMMGYTSHYRNGFDGQGLWVEVEVEKELGFKTKKDIEKFGLDNFTDACVARVRKYSDIITEQSKMLGQWMDWNNSYYTMTDENIIGIWAFLKKCHEKNMIIETYKPMPWCARCGTSLSEHEMTGSYHDVEHDAVFFKLPLDNSDSNILVWTTTPWTLSANTALAVNPELDYVKVKFPNENKPLILSLSVFNNRFRKDGGEILDTFKGTKLKGIKYETCFPDFPLQKEINHRIVLWEEVSNEDGSGIVHIAPGCGAEDFELGQKENLDIIVPIDEDGKILDNFGFLSGKSAKEVNDIVFEELKKQDKLFFTHKITHSYPFCWRCKEDILFRLGKEWAIDVDVVRQDLINNAQKVKWYPEYQGKRMLDWLNNMSNWNISRRRFYGLPLPFYKCECGHVEVIGSKEELREKAANKDLVDNIKELHRPWIDEIKINCPMCGKEISRIEQVGDVWLDAGIVPFSTLKYLTDKEYWKEYFPAEYVVEMHEQIRLWFYSMLFMSTVLENKPPYEAVGTHGMVTAEDGTKFSKTGYSISFEEATTKIGVDPSRYLFAGANPINDMRFGFSFGEEAKRKMLSLWNIVSFFDLYYRIDKPDLTKDILASDLSDKWLENRINKFVSESKDCFENYDASNVVKLFELCIDDVSNWYIRINRKRFWKSEMNDDKLSAYKTLYNSIKKILQVMAPIIPFMTDYIWKELVLDIEQEDISVHLSSFPNKEDYDQKLLDEVEIIREVITGALKLRNESNLKVKQPLNTLYLMGYDEIKRYENTIKDELNIKNIEYLDNKDSICVEYLSLDFKVAGTLFKEKVNEIKDLVTNISDMNKVVQDYKNNSEIAIEGINIPKEALKLNYKYKEDVVVNENNDKLIGINISIDDNLLEEGLYREILRYCQVLRKEANFDIVDRIEIGFITEDDKINSMIDKYMKELEQETLSKVVKEQLSNYTFEKEIEIYDSKVSIQMKKSS